MAQEQRKTLRDYLHKGGIQGRYFFVCRCGVKDETSRIYKVIKIISVPVFGENDLEVKHIGKRYEELCPLKLRYHDVEATTEEVQRAKESTLAQNLKRI